MKLYCVVSLIHFCLFFAFTVAKVENEKPDMKRNKRPKATGEFVKPNGLFGEVVPILKSLFNPVASEVPHAATTVIKSAKSLSGSSPTAHIIGEVTQRFQPPSLIHTAQNAAMKTKVYSEITNAKKLARLSYRAKVHANDEFGRMSRKQTAHVSDWKFNPPSPVGTPPRTPSPVGTPGGTRPGTPIDEGEWFNPHQQTEHAEHADFFDLFKTTRSQQFSDD